MSNSFFPSSAIVLAAGKGTRMRPVTDTIPKPMVQVLGRSLVHRVLDTLLDTSLTTVVVNTHHLSDKLTDHVQSHPITASDRIQCDCLYEEVLLETGGGVVNALPYLKNPPFFAINSDVLWTDTGQVPALERLASAWDPEKMDGLLLLHPVEKAIGYDGQGDFSLTEEGQLAKTPGSAAPYVFTGIQIISPTLVESVSDKVFSLSQVYRERWQEETSTLKRLYGVVHDGDWLHVGTVEGIKEAEQYLSSEPCVSTVV